MKRGLALVVLLGLGLSCKKREEPPPPGESPEMKSRREAAIRAGRAAASAAAAARLAEAQAVPGADEMNLSAEFGTMNVPADNPQTDEKVALGQKLFFDKRLSVDGSMSCYSCHQNEDGNGGKDPVAIGVRGKKLARHSPVIWNVGYLPRLYWDGRAGTLEELGAEAWAGGGMGIGKDNLEKKAQELGKIAGYKAEFDKVFPGEGATAKTVVKALSSYQRSLVCNDTDYDRFAKGNRSALDAEEKRGLELFMGKAACVACHAPPFFSTSFLVKAGAYFNVGVGFSGKTPENVDPGRKKLTGSDADFGAFKVPSLRNVSKSAPYFHDGSVPTLEVAVRFMASGGMKNPGLSPLMTDKQLSDAEINSLVAFLGTLECQAKLAEPKLP